ncbi:hypothetical protein D3C85_1849120 [compost metagenome]
MINSKNRIEFLERENILEIIGYVFANGELESILGSLSLAILWIITESWFVVSLWK